MSGNIKELQISFNPFVERKRILRAMNESKLFSLIKNLYPDLQKTEEFDSSDVFSLVKKFRAELKCRYEHYDNLLIEKIKWDKLMQCDDEKVLYICSTTEGIWMFNIKELPEPIWEVQMHNKTTEFSNNDKIPKLVGFYDLNQGKEITNKLI
jgi:hypothetical protein